MPDEYTDILNAVAAECEGRMAYWAAAADGIAARSPHDPEVERCRNLSRLSERRRDAAQRGKVLVSDWDSNDRLDNLNKARDLAGPFRTEVDKPEKSHTRWLRGGSIGRIA